jgi:uroporphyrinogen decarboxylase
MTAMTSRQRVLAALNHQEPDRAPLDVGGTFATGIHLHAYEALMAQLGLEPPATLLSPRTSLADPHESLLQNLGSDCRALHPPAPDSAPGILEADGSLVDWWGVRFVKPPGGHYYVRDAVLGGSISQHDVRNYPWPDPTDPSLVRGIADQAQALHEGSDSAIVLNLPVGFVHQAQFLRGFEEWLIDLAADPGLAEILMDSILDVWLEMALRMVRAAGPYVDVVFYGDDIAYQQGLLMSPRTYRRLVRPHQARLLQALHGATDAKILYHSCGSVHAVLGDLIDIGIDALNPVQVSATGMDTAWLKREFGDRLSFWGGVDTHAVLPRGAPDDVRAEVRRRVEDLAQDGGYVIASVHNIQAEVPPENIVTMCDPSLRIRDCAGESRISRRQAEQERRS